MAPTAPRAQTKTATYNILPKQLRFDLLFQHLFLPSFILFPKDEWVGLSPSRKQTFMNHLLFHLTQFSKTQGSQVCIMLYAYVYSVAELGSYLAKVDQTVHA